MMAGRDEGAGRENRGIIALLAEGSRSSSSSSVIDSNN